MGEELTNTRRYIVTLATMGESERREFEDEDAAGVLEQIAEFVRGYTDRMQVTIERVDDG